MVCYKENQNNNIGLVKMDRPVQLKKLWLYFNKIRLNHLNSGNDDAQQNKMKLLRIII